jgi:alkaline phosphatase D
MAEEDLDLVVHLGDYIYEGAGNPQAIRSHNGPEPLTLEEYRNRHALYKTDPNLQAAHAAFPWTFTWDDHEVDNNWADEIPQDPEQQSTASISGSTRQRFQGVLRTYAPAPVFHA